MYVDLAGLARYKSDFGAWARGALLPKDAAAARVRTAKAGAVSLVPVQRTPLDVSVDFLFAETPPASGDKGPTNPSTITGVSSVKVTRCGKNLISTPYKSGPSFTQHGYTITENQDGSLTLNGSSDGQGACHFNLTSNYSFKLHAGISYAASITNINNSEVILQGFDSAGSIKFTAFADGTPRIFTLNNDEYVTIRMSVTKLAGTLANAVVRPQLELGSTATSFESYAGTDYTLPLGNTYYGGTLDVASGVMTVTWEGVVFDGTENWTLHPDSSRNFIAFILQPFVPVTSSIYTGGISSSIGNSVICSHFANRTSAPEPNSFYIAGKNAARLVVKNNTDLYSDLPTFKTWLSQQYASGTPLSLVCALAVPYTVQLTPTQILSLTQSSDYDPRVNTVYSDQSAVQVGYLKHPSAASADLRSALVSLGGGV